MAVEDVWHYSGHAGEMLTVYMIADHPGMYDWASQSAPAEALDTLLILRNPDGSLLATDSLYAPGGNTMIANAAIQNVVLPTDGLYTIEARSDGGMTGGPYSLIIDSSLGSNSQSP